MTFEVIFHSLKKNHEILDFKKDTKIKAIFNHKYEYEVI